MNVFTDNTLIIWLACVISHLKTSTHVKAARIKNKLEFGMYPQSMPTEWTHARTLRPWQSVRLDL